MDEVWDQGKDDCGDVQESYSKNKQAETNSVHVIQVDTSP